MLHLDRAKSTIIEDMLNNDDDQFFQMTKKYIEKHTSFNSGGARKVAFKGIS